MVQYNIRYIKKGGDELNEVKKLRINSDRVEKVARAEFVKVEASALAEAVRQTAIHAETVAEAQKVQIIAQAEAEAARIKQEVLDELLSKKSADNVEEIPVGAFLRETLSLCQEKFRSYGIDIEVKQGTGVTKIVGRRVELSQVIVNLMNNAFDAVKDEKV